MANKSAPSVLVVEVTDEALDEIKPYTDKTTGMTRPGKTKQRCYLHTGARHPVPFKVSVPEAGPYRPGMYVLAGVDIFKPGDFDGLKFSDRTLELVSVTDAIEQMRPHSAALKAAS